MEGKKNNTDFRNKKYNNQNEKSTMGCEQEPGGRGNHQRPGKSINEMISSQGMED